MTSTGDARTRGPSGRDTTAGNGVDSTVRDGAGGPPALVVEGLRKRFGDGDDAVTAVDGVSLTIEQGSVVGLLGPNGAGKTTLIKCVLGMVLPGEGHVSIHGVDVYDQPRRAYAHVDAMLEGARNDYWRLTVRENLRYFATVGGVDPDSVAGRHERLLDQFDLSEQADVPVRKLSRGMKQKVSLASVLASESDVVFLDEPTLGLDVESSRTLRRELRRIVEERNLTVVVSSHDMDVIEDVCDRVVIVNEGRVVADDTVANLLRGSGVHRYRVTSPNLDAAVVDALERDAALDVTDVAVTPGGPTRVEVVADSDGFYALVDVLRRHDVVVDAVTTVSHDLEEVFVGLTGDGAGERPERVEGRR